MVTSVKETSHTPFSEEDVAVVSKHDTSIVWAGTKVMYSGIPEGTPQQASGYNYGSGESDIEPIGISLSGWGKIRIPELNQLHKLFVFPKNPHLIARVDYSTLTLGVTAIWNRWMQRKSSTATMEPLLQRMWHCWHLWRFCLIWRLCIQLWSCRCPSFWKYKLKNTSLFFYFF